LCVKADWVDGVDPDHRITLLYIGSLAGATVLLVDDLSLGTAEQGVVSRCMMQERVYCSGLAQAMWTARVDAVLTPLPPQQGQSSDEVVDWM